MELEFFPIPGPILIRTRIFEDMRGGFTESFNLESFAKAQLPHAFVQDNQSISKKGVIRGLHYQKPPFAQGKLVRVVKGSALDVAVDIRTGSPTFGQHIRVLLSEHEPSQLWIPEGFAHGFSALEEGTCFLYKCTNYYSPQHETGICWNDPALGIDWGVENPIVSEKDMALPELKQSLNDFHYAQS
ncbi:MAG: dTDP-4-dehydrorhamnose 3,5-epimerase [Sphingobacteriales bacterium]|jgi:dTDP-4-dehydrorhamnose 3,5-epimerase|nr:dTDP-4-dehydrorhamnose 3,5-epimerase [Sphingobacteriales bacterium]